MEVICTLCEGEDAKVPYEMMMAHIALLHGDIEAAITQESVTAIELQCAHAHLQEAYEKLDRGNYSTGREYRVIMERIEVLGRALSELIQVNERAER